MRQMIKNILMVLLLTAICTSECAARKRSAFSPDPRFLAIQTLSVLPIVDARAGTKAGVNMGKLQGGVVSVMKRKRYPASGVSTTGDAGAIAEEDLQGASPAFIKKLGPADARWVMVVCLDNVASKITFGSTGNAEVSGFLFDKEKGELVWAGKGVGQAGQGGLMGMTMVGMMKGEALSFALSNLLNGIPNRPKPGR